VRAFLFSSSQATEQFRAPAGARVTSPLLVQRRSNQEETTPRWCALQASCLAGARAGGGVFRRDSCPGEKLARIPAGHPADFPPPTRRAIGAPGRAARSQRAEARTRARAASLRRLRCCFWRARCAPALPGPLGGGEAGTTRPRSGRGHGWTRLFARAGARSANHHEAGPATPHALSVHGWTESANRDGLLFGLLFSDSGHPALRPSGQLRCSPALQARAWPHKRKVTRAPAGVRNRFDTCENKAKAPSPLPLSHKRERGGLRT
jgi:hypothetical protein